VTMRLVRLPLMAVALWTGGTAFGAAQMAIHGAEIVDSGGRRITVNRPYERIISLYGAHTENLCAMGATSRMIGVCGRADRALANRDIPVYSYHDGLEKFLSARPDLVLIRPMIDRGYNRLMRRLEGHGVTVVSLQPATPEQMFVYWKILGKLSGRPDPAQRMIDRFKRSTGCIGRRTAAVRDKRRVYFEAIHDRMRTFAPTAMAMFVLQTAGGINVARDAAPRRGTNIADYGKERILARGDEIDVYLAQYGPMNRPTIEAIKAEPGYDLIRAVRQDQIYLIDEELVSRPTPRLLAGIRRIGSILYPDMFNEDAGAAGCWQQTNGPAGTRTQKEIRP
jgi:iron complex transport system substrate-binding protein